MEKYIKFRNHIKDEYDKLFDEWYRDLGIKKAKLIVLADENSITSGYCKHCDTIILSQGQANFEDIGITYMKGWKSWRSELVHEMIHEYQYKINPQVTKLGKELFEKFQSTENIPRASDEGTGFPGEGHDEVFYTSICIIAPKFRFTPLELKQHI